MAYEYNNPNMCMGWDDTLENDGQEYFLLEEGDYNFTVTNFERGRFPGSAKIPACNKASLTVAVHTPDGTATCKFDLILFRSLEWRLSAFFRCIGQKKQGERLVMDWNKVVGSKGRARFKLREYQNKDGETRYANDIDKFYDYDPKFFPEEQEWVKQAEKETAEPWDGGNF